MADLRLLSASLFRPLWADSGSSSQTMTGSHVYTINVAIPDRAPFLLVACGESESLWSTKEKFPAKSVNKKSTCLVAIYANTMYV